MAAAQRFCDRAMLLEKGQVVEIGDAEHVANRYLETNFGVGVKQPVELTEAGVEERLGDGRARVQDAWFEDEGGTRVDAVSTGGTLVHASRIVFFHEVLDPVFSVTFELPDGALVLAADVGNRGRELGAFAAGEEVVVRTRLQNVLAPDRYRVTPSVADHGGLRPIDRPVGLQTLTVSGTRFSAGLVDLPIDFAIDRTGERV
jgi:hypothetical protein